MKGELSYEESMRPVLQGKMVKLSKIKLVKANNPYFFVKPDIPGVELSANSEQGQEHL